MKQCQKPALNEGVAIPHGKSATVSEPAFAVARLTRPVADWPTMDGEDQVELVFLLAVPERDDEGHLRLLSSLSTALMNEENIAALKEADSVQAFLARLDCAETTQNYEVVNDTGKSVIVITACSAGIAHTYMAAEALEKAGAARGITVFSEKQGRRN